MLIDAEHRAVIHPLDMAEGGFCQVVERVFNELAPGRGAYRVVLHRGDELTRDEALKLLDG